MASVTFSYLRHLHYLIVVGCCRKEFNSHFFLNTRLSLLLFFFAIFSLCLVLMCHFNLPWGR